MLHIDLFELSSYNLTFSLDLNHIESWSVYAPWLQTHALDWLWLSLLCCIRQSRAPNIDRCASESDLDIWPGPVTLTPNFAMESHSGHKTIRGSGFRCTSFTCNPDSPVPVLLDSSIFVTHRWKEADQTRYLGVKIAASHAFLLELLSRQSHYKDGVSTSENSVLSRHCQQQGVDSHEFDCRHAIFIVSAVLWITLLSWLSRPRRSDSRQTIVSCDNSSISHPIK